MVQKSESKKGTAILNGVWITQLYEHIEYFESHKDLRELKIMLPFGVERERKPKNYEKDYLRKQGVSEDPARLKRIATDRLGMFHVDKKIEVPEWKPRQKIMTVSEDHVKYKPSLFILRWDPSEKREMYIEQDLMAKSISHKIEKKTGYSVRVDKGYNVVVRRYFVMVSKEDMLKLVSDFIAECNRILYIHCDTR